MITIFKQRRFRMYKSIDLFAGIGGIRKGFDRAFGKKIKTVFVSEWDEFAQKTYKMNYHDKFDIAGDITQIDEKEIPEFDICLAGFPTTSAKSGTSRTTTAPAPMSAYFPIVIPQTIVTFAPIEQPFLSKVF